jgi:hypothetical protein
LKTLEIMEDFGEFGENWGTRGVFGEIEAIGEI